MRPFRKFTAAEIRVRKTNKPETVRLYIINKWKLAFCANDSAVYAAVPRKIVLRLGASREPGF